MCSHCQGEIRNATNKPFSRNLIVLDCRSSVALGVCSTTDERQSEELSFNRDWAEKAFADVQSPAVAANRLVVVQKARSVIRRETAHQVETRFD